MFSRPTFKILVSSILTITTVVLATHCQRLLPGKSDHTGSVSLVMDTSSLPSDLAAQMKSLRARVYKVESEVLAGQDGVGTAAG